MTSVRSDTRSFSSDLNLDNNKLSELPPDVFSDLSSLRSLVCLKEGETVCVCVFVMVCVFLVCVSIPPPSTGNLF